MTPTLFRLRHGACLSALVGLAACGLAPPAATPDGGSKPAAAAHAASAAETVPPPPALHVEGALPVTRELLAQTQRWQRVAGHRFVGWHPTQREMLVAHRAPEASTLQLYRLRAPMAQLEPLTDGPDPVAMARWEPREGRYIVFARGSGGDEAYQLYRLDPQTRQTTALTPADQRHSLLAWLKTRALMVVASLPLDRNAERTGAGPGRRSEVLTRLSLIDPLQATPPRVLTELPGAGWQAAEASPDEKQLAITRYVSATESEVWLVDLASGQRRRILPAPGEPQWASHSVGAWTSDGKSLLVTTDRAGEFRELLRLDLERGTLVRLSAQTPWDVSLDSTSPDGRSAALRVNVDGRDELQLVDTATGAQRALPALPAGSVTRGEFHATRAELALMVNSPRAPSQIWSLEPGSGRLTAWTQPSGTEGLNLQALPEQQIVRFKAFDGRTLSGVLSLPPVRFAGRRPVLLLMHGGPESQARPGWRGQLNHLVEQLGVALLEPNVRGSSGYGKTFLNLDNGRLREDSVRDMASALDWIATQPRLDAARVLVMGGSYGGYMALAASTRLAERIAGAVSSVGISNFVSFLENTESYRRDLRRVEYGDERDPAMRAFLQEISPLTQAARISKPLLVVQGRNDPRVPWTEAEQIVRSLQARGSPVWYLLADNEGHGYARRENADYTFATVVRFVEHTLRP